MNSENKFTPSDKGILDRRQSKVSSDSFAVKRDSLAKKVVGNFIGDNDSDSLYNSLSGKSGQRQREKFESIVKIAERVWLPEFKNSFSEKLDILRQNGDLNISPEEVKKRLSDVQIFFFDKGTKAGEKVDAKGANSRYSTVHIEIDTNFNGDENEFLADLQHTFNHEMLHAISGSLFLTTPRHLGVFNTDKYRRGLVFGPTIMGDDIERFSWLNEAVTETLALEMDENKDTDFLSYKNERLLLSLLINGPVGGSEQKIDKKKFYHAYFESYQEKDSAENRLKYWKELIHSINSAFYPGFLLKLDKLIKEKGVGYMVSNFQHICENKI